VAFEKITGHDASGNPITDSTNTKTEYEDGYLPLMLSDGSLCNKQFDAGGNVKTGSHARGPARTQNGSNYWGDSNIRDWLNSSDDTVTYTCGNPPSYKDEKGFLANFNDTEKAAIKTVTQKSLLAGADKSVSGATGSAEHTKNANISDVVQNYDAAYSEQVTDTMFLLDVQQLKNVYDYDNDYYKLSVDYWLRSPYSVYYYSVRYVDSVDNIVSYYSARHDKSGVRPAFYLDPSSTLLCGDGKKETPYKVEHSYSTSWSKDANNHWIECTVCHDKKDNAAHSWNDGEITTAATCTTDGVKTYTCTVCSQTKTETITQTGHNYSTSWSKNADNHWHECAKCGDKKDSAAHSWNSGEITTAATCTTDGAKKYTCTVCGQTKAETVTQTGHNYKYTASGGVITGTCQNNTAHTVTATLTAQNATYDGMAKTTGSVAYSDGWTGGELTVSYQNNTNAGTATASITYGGATASVNFQIAKAAPTVTAPSVAIDYTAETLSTTAAMEYSIDGGTSWTACTANMAATAFDGWDGSADKAVQFRLTGDDNHNPGAVQSVTIPARPNVPYIAMELTKTTDSLTVTNTDNYPGCEFSIDGTTWEDAGAFTGLTAGQEYTAQFRVKATGSSFHSKSLKQKVTTVAADGSTTLKIGEIAKTGGSIIANDGEKVTIENGGTATVITPPFGSAIEIGPGGVVNVPNNGTVQTEEGPIITLPQGGTVDGDGNIALPGGGSVTVPDDNGGSATITVPDGGGTITPGENGAVTVPGGSTVTTGGQTVTIPESGGIVVPGGEVTYTVTVTFDAQGGSAVKSQTVTVGEKVTEPTVPAKSGYIFDGWYTEAACTTSWDFDTPVTGDMTLYVKWTKKPSPVMPGPVTPDPDDTPAPPVWENPFADVKESDWYYAAVEFANENGLFYGTSDTTFEPNSDMSRGMLATVLYRLAKEPGITAEDLFSDVADGKYYTEAVAWAAENKIVAGYGNGKFGPEDSITREQLATILWRYAGSPESTGNLDKFTDGAKTSDWAVPALQWAVEQKIVSGKGNGILDPRGKATRAEVAAMLMRYCEKVE